MSVRLGREHNTFLSYHHCVAYACAYVRINTDVNADVTKYTFCRLFCTQHRLYSTAELFSSNKQQNELTNSNWLLVQQKVFLWAWFTSCKQNYQNTVCMIILFWLNFMQVKKIYIDCHEESHTKLQRTGYNSTMN